MPSRTAPPLTFRSQWRAGSSKVAASESEGVEAATSAGLCYYLFVNKKLAAEAQCGSHDTSLYTPG